MLAPDIHTFAHKYGYKIKADADKLSISSRFYLFSNQSIFIIVTIIIGFLLLIVPFFKEYKFETIIQNVIASIFAFLLGILNLISHLNQKIIISDNQIYINSKFKKRIVYLLNNHTFKMKSSHYTGLRTNNKYINIEIFLQSDNAKHKVISFSDTTDNEDKAIHFGSEIKQVLNQYKNHLTH